MSFSKSHREWESLKNNALSFAVKVRNPMRYTRKTLISASHVPKGSERTRLRIKTEKERSPGEINVAGAMLLSPAQFNFRFPVYFYFRGFNVLFDKAFFI